MATKKTLVYQLWPLSWGSFRAMTLFLQKIAVLGADYVCLGPVFMSPLKNHGYDVSDYYMVNPRFGTIKDFDEFVRSAHLLGLKVILDLPIDSTSVEHNWFITAPHMYVWSRNGNPLKQNMVGGPAWLKANNGKYYLSLNHPAEATINWFNGTVINRDTIECFKKIMSYWLCEHEVDGFRLEFVQLLNETAAGENDFLNFLTGWRSVNVVDKLSNLYTGKSPFLIMDLIDPKCGEVCDFYADKTDVEFVTNRALKSTATPRSKTLNSLKKKINSQAKNYKFMLDLENHDTPRFTSRTGKDPLEILSCMFTSKARAICLYQGQELGLENPKDLTTQEILYLDSKAELQYALNQASAETLRQTSCANVRVPLPLDEYARQETDPNSILANTIAYIQKWKHF